MDKATINADNLAYKALFEYRMQDMIPIDELDSYDGKKGIKDLAIEHIDIYSEEAWSGDALEVQKMHESGPESPVFYIIDSNCERTALTSFYASAYGTKWYVRRK